MTSPQPPGWSSVDEPDRRLSGRGRARAGRRRRDGRARPAASAVLALTLLVALVVVLATRNGAQAVHLVPRSAPVRDALAFDPGKAAELQRAAAAGLSQVIYAKSPGGVLVSAARTARFRPLIEQATAGTGIDPDLVEAIVLLESAGRPEVIAGSDPAGAAGLTQILAGTATSFLGMQVDLAASRRLTKRIEAAGRSGKVAEQLRLTARRRVVDARFDPATALAGTVHYLSVARERFGRDDLAAVSYHMGIGNLESVLRAYAAAADGTAIRDVVSQDDLTWARVYFDSSPIDHADAWRRLSGFDDDSQTYYWRVLAAEEIMRLYREDPERLEALAYLHDRKASAEEVLHPEPATEQFWTPADLVRAGQEGVLQPLPNDPARLHFKLDRRLGELAPEMGRSRALYRQLRPEALALLLYLADRVHAIGGSSTPLTLTSAVRDDAYQQLVVARNAEATTGYSLHTTGYAFDLLRRYGSGAQAQALQYMLDRLQALNLIAWVREPTAIHVTVSSQALELVSAYLAPGS